MRFCQIQLAQGCPIPTFFSAWYLVCCILEFVLDRSKLSTTISSKYFQLLIFERISCIHVHRTVSYSIRTEKEFNGWNFLHNLQKNYVGEASRNLSTKISTNLPAQEKIYLVQLNSAPINISKTQDWSQKYYEYGHYSYSKLY